MLVSVLVGLVVGLFSGIVGLGGGIILIPILVYGYKMSQHAAQGTTLAVLTLPVVFFATFQYWRAGNVDVRLAMLIAAGFVVGGYFGGGLAQNLPAPALRKMFAVVIMFVAVNMFFKK